MLSNVFNLVDLDQELSITLSTSWNDAWFEVDLDKLIYNF